MADSDGATATLEAPAGEVIDPEFTVTPDAPAEGVASADTPEPAPAGAEPPPDPPVVTAAATPDPDPDDDKEEPDTVLSEPAPGPRLNLALAYDSPERLSLYDSETVRLINDAKIQLADAREEYEECKKAAKAAKDEWESAAKRLEKLIDERAANRGKPVQATLFDEHGNTRASAEVKAQTHWAAQDDIRSPEDVPAPAPAPDEAWKAVPLADLVEHDGLPQKVADLLADPVHKDRGPIPPITTMGHLATYTAPQANGWVDKITDIKGLGPAKEEALSEATAKFWARWNATQVANHANSKADAGDGAEAPVDDPHVGGGEPVNARPGGGPGDEPGDGRSGDATPGGGGGPAEGAEGKPVSDAEWFNGDADAAPAPEATADEPAGYQTEGVKRVAKRMRERQGKAAG